MSLPTEIDSKSLLIKKSFIFKSSDKPVNIISTVEQVIPVSFLRNRGVLVRDNSGFGGGSCNIFHILFEIRPARFAGRFSSSTGIMGVGGPNTLH